MSEHSRLPAWIKRPVPDAATLAGMKQLFDGLRLHTVCESAHCPNQGICFRQGTATFMILGDTCTRSCTFCAVSHGDPQSVDPGEPEHLVEAIGKLRLRHVVITSVTRDDLEDGGASQFSQCVEAIRRYDNSVTVEVLVPDFGGSLSSLRRVLDSSPAVLNHNVETVPRLYPEVRSQARYERSLELLKRAKAERAHILTKSGLMLGLGETREEVIAVMRDLREAGCDIVTIGQYLRPSPKHHQVERFVPPEEFEEYGKAGKGLGFRYVASAPFVRSSFHAAEILSTVDRPTGHHTEISAARD